MNAYLSSAADARKTLRMAMYEAIDLLPDEIRTQHWMAAQHSPTPWESVKYWYLNQEGMDWRLANILSDLVLLAHALQCVTSVTLPEPGGAPDLRLVRTRK